jgi:hypothetical protein
MKYLIVVSVTIICIMVALGSEKPTVSKSIDDMFNGTTKEVSLNMWNYRY